MENIIFYFVKSSLLLSGFTVVYIVLLRPLTFYAWNRAFLIISVVLSAFLPMINVAQFLPSSGASFVPAVPALESYLSAPGEGPMSLGGYEIIAVCIACGSLLLTSRLLVRLISLWAVARSSVLISRSKGVGVYSCSHSTEPFSFGSRIFLNPALHTPEEIDTIVLHETAHVRQGHTADLLLGELVSICNWYNPLMWIWKSAMRRNLEYLADAAVLSRGLPRHRYQEALLAVAGLPSRSMVNTFSSGHLKKRIQMMNTNRSHSHHQIKYMSIIPLIVFGLLLSRSHEALSQEAQKVTGYSGSGVIIHEGSGDVKKALYVVDGLVQAAPFDLKSLEPSDISQVTVLKGDSALAHYGRNGTNGVIIIHTKLPLYVIDGVIQAKNSKAGRLLESETIRSMNVLTPPEAVKRYGEPGANGAIEIIKK